MTTITKQFTQYLQHHRLTWGEMDTIEQYRAWVAFLCEWRARA